MRAKFVYEAMEDILRPKSEEEILSHLGDLDPNRLLVKSSRLGLLSGVKLALERKADVHHWDDEALQWASIYGRKNIVELLLKNGADVHANDEGALRLASKYNHKDVVEFLKKYI
jgi:ankyrin repeat protein